MKRKLLFILMITVLMLALSGCGKDKKQAETVNELPVTGAEVAEENVAEPVEEKAPEQIPALTEDEKVMLENAMYIFPLYETALPTAEQAGWILDNLLVFDSSSPGLGIHYVSGSEPSPISIDYYGLEKGDVCDYHGVETKVLEKFIGDFYGQVYSLPEGALNYDTCVNANGKCVEWSTSYHVSYEGWGLEITITDYHVTNNQLVCEITTREYNAFDDDVVTTGEAIFRYNPDSMLHYSLVAYNKLSEEAIASDDEEDEDDWDNNKGEESWEERYEITFTREEITAEEGRIRNAVNSGMAAKVELSAGTDQVPFGRWYCYENGKLIFAYYYNQPDRKDMRMYFKDDCMIELIEGSSDADRVRTYLTDNPGSKWDELEWEVLRAAAGYVPQ